MAEKASRLSPAQTWAGLNLRQQVYLTAIYRQDQAVEGEMASWDWFRLGRKPPASTWRWLRYDVEGDEHTAIQRELAAAGQLNEGAGSTLAVLRRRELIEESDDVVLTVLGPRAVLLVKLTTFGRAVARAGLGIVPVAKPRGLLSEWPWRALVRLYPAGEDGVSSDDLRRGESISPSTQKTLRDRPEGGFLDMFTVTSRASGINPLTGWEYATKYDTRWRLTPAGRRHYELHHACYAEHHPEIEAPAPTVEHPLAHGGLAEHTARPPRHLVREVELRVLAALVEKEGATGGPHSAGSPAWGSEQWAARKARSKKAVDHLVGHRDGPLVEIHEYEHRRRVWRMVALTDAGREHYARHRDEYQRTYPDVELPAVDPVD